MSIADEWREATTAEELRGVWTARSREETKPDKRPRHTPAEKKEGVHKGERRDDEIDRSGDLNSKCPSLSITNADFTLK
ncbi:hypothetical protein F2Q69_00013163 [Brassica cretica]|uniref:Uncharacterized protein n=1 Tax=Brassica cretica TaxID=69181 RepID=A0A8S9R872_BRACR|nr:hypothetical protein F2Q69_00013163 [Brassica cretica]